MIIVINAPVRAAPDAIIQGETLIDGLACNGAAISYCEDIMRDHEAKRLERTTDPPQVHTPNPCDPKGSTPIASGSSGGFWEKRKITINPNFSLKRKGNRKLVDRLGFVRRSTGYVFAWIQYYLIGYEWEYIPPNAGSGTRW